MSSAKDYFLIFFTFFPLLSVLQGYHFIPFKYERLLSGCSLSCLYPLFEYEYYQTGDVIIGGLFSVHNSIQYLKVSDGVFDLKYVCLHLDPEEYEYLMAFFFAIDDINKDPHLLPNITLGYHLFDTSGYSLKAIESTIKILSGHKRKAPNYFGVERPEVAGFVGDTIFPSTLAVAELLNVYQYTQDPQARCNEPCSMGYRKGPTEGIHACCYRCVPCSDGEVSNITDSDLCHKCPDDHWPDERKVKCIPKTYDYLSYDMDIMTQVFYVISILCSAVTLSILTLFILFRDTPVVKANNRTVSFILLTSILLSFLCVFLFLGRPVDITCMLRQMSFGIFFSIAVSSVLAKTITVCIAFKAAKPSSYWKKWVGGNFSSSVIIICSSVQVLICVIWLSVSPPYQEYDMDSYPGKIIIQCNEGSVIGFYSVLGYMGFLAAVSFVLAFMVRTLPDSFNDAKYITFSMLVFCSVWIAMIPAYLSTRGKYMVAVEIFSILACSAGLLGCIFIPKCYIIIMKPQRNSKKHIIGKSNHDIIFQ